MPRQLLLLLLLLEALVASVVIRPRTRDLRPQEGPKEGKHHSSNGILYAHCGGGAGLCLKRGGGLGPKSL